MRTLCRNFTIIVSAPSEIVNTGTCKPHGCDIVVPLPLSLSLSLSLSLAQNVEHYSAAFSSRSARMSSKFPKHRANCERHNVNAASRSDVGDISQRCFVDRITSGFHAEPHFGRRKRSSNLSELSFYCDDHRIKGYYFLILRFSIGF